MGRKFALIIGNSQYEDAGLARLSAPDADVQALADVLRDGSVGAFDSVESIVNESFAYTRRAIARFFDDRKRDDLLILYFSGHGVRDEYGHLHLAVRDTERALLAATAIEAAFVSECMDRSASKRLVLVLDCCHSGAFGYGSKSAQGASVGTAVAFEGTGRGRIVLTATDATQYAWEGDTVVGMAQPSVFTRHVTQGLRTGAADLDGDGVVTIDELYDYVYDQVLTDTTKQTPGKWAFGQQGDIVIARNPAAADKCGEELHARPLAPRSGNRSQQVESAPAVAQVPVDATGSVLSRFRPVVIIAILATTVVLGIIAQSIRSRPMQEAIEHPPVAQPETQSGSTVAAANPGSSTPAPQTKTSEPGGTAVAGGDGPVATRRSHETSAQTRKRPGSTARPRSSAASDTTTERPAVTSVIDSRPPVVVPAGDATLGGPPATTAPDTGVAPAPPAAGPTPVAVSVDSQIESTLAQYTQARNALDLEALKDVWPNAPVASLRRVYAGISSESVQLTKCTKAAAEGATASVECDEQVRSKFTTGGGDSRTSRATFSLRREGDRWVITQIKRR